MSDTSNFWKALDLMVVFEDVCPICGSDWISNTSVECHSEMEGCWPPECVHEMVLNDGMAPDVGTQGIADSWLSDCLAIHISQCLNCGQAYQFEQDVFGEWAGWELYESIHRGDCDLHSW